MRYDEITLGQTYEVKRKITAKMVETFAEITGDKNPVHLDEEFASKTVFKKRISHGILSVGLISAVLGMEFPGPGTIYMKQDTKFLKPIYLDEEITIKITVKEKIDEKSRLILTTQIIKENGKIAVDGEALVLFKGE
ncbi:enoyl-CoA hydratase [Marinitoga sp. 1154]|uniref:MaoC family dehydratase n=1 Tax=Marinitoga sp. 1154 TaxID=1643335 RepID=UPI00158612B2|nr:MaoC family dehydratase [Marinitoga sp. 1154]NUU99274.1 enoyl-CoA hydratase [Marinitoga sp. 1154]